MEGRTRRPMAASASLVRGTSSACGGAVASGSVCSTTLCTLPKNSVSCTCSIGKIGKAGKRRLSQNLYYEHRRLSM